MVKKKNGIQFGLASGSLQKQENKILYVKNDRSNNKRRGNIK